MPRLLLVLLFACGQAVAADRPAYVFPKPPLAEAPKALSDGDAIRLYPGEGPGTASVPYDPNSSLDVPALLVQTPPAGVPITAAVLSVPGGSYHHISVRFPDDYSRQLASQGVVTFFLLYRFGQRHPWPAPLQDGTRAWEIIRTHAKDWGIDPKRIGIFGFSAGGHVATWLGTGGPGGKDALTPAPAFLGLVSPVVSFREDWAGTRSNILPKDTPNSAFEAMSGDTMVTKSSPPMFLWHAKDDRLVGCQQNSGKLKAACDAAGVACIYENPDKGGHVGGKTTAYQAGLSAFLAKGGWLAASH